MILAAMYSGGLGASNLQCGTFLSSVTGLHHLDFTEESRYVLSC